MKSQRNNTTKCSKCGLSLIQEESQSHECIKIMQKRVYFDTDNDFIEIFDGFRWIPIKSDHQPRGNTHNTTEEGTEPENEFFIKKWYRTMQKL